VDLVSLTLGLPLAPLRGVLAVARLLQERAEQELYSPAQGRQELEEIEAARERQELPDEVTEQEEQRVMNRLLRR
jgi:hypothetical protein